MSSRDLGYVSNALNSVGWFVPPYLSTGLLDAVALTIARNKGIFTQDNLEQVLAKVYDADRLASMVVNRYPQTPTIQLFSKTIAEAVMAHFIGLHHVAVGGLIPVIEGAARRLVASRGLKTEKTVKRAFVVLVDSAKQEVVQRRIGMTEELVNMLDSFSEFVDKFFYSQSQSYPLTDNTNRPGVAHGAFTDAEYGSPISFYKTIAAVDFLTLVSSLRTPRMSGFAPNSTPESKILATRYLEANRILT